MKRVLQALLLSATLSLILAHLSSAGETATIRAGHFAADTENEYLAARELAIKKNFARLKALFASGKIFALPEGVMVEIVTVNDTNLTCSIGIPGSGIYYWTSIEAVKPGYRPRQSVQETTHNTLPDPVANAGRPARPDSFAELDPNAEEASKIVSSLRGLKAATLMFYAGHQNEVDAGRCNSVINAGNGVKELLEQYLDNPLGPEYFLKIQQVKGKSAWVVGCDLSKTSDRVKQRLQKRNRQQSLLDKNDKLYDGGDVVLMVGR